MSSRYGKHCEGCPLFGLSDPQIRKGPSDARFLVVTDVPNYRPEAYGRFLSRSAMSLFSGVMGAERFVKEDFAYAPHVRCPYDASQYTTKEKRQIAKSCRPYLVEEAKRLKPEVVIPLGAEASRQVFGRAVKITKVRGVPSLSEDFPGAVVLPFLSPGMVVAYPQHEPTMRSDAATLGRLVDYGYDMDLSVESVLGDYKIVDDLQFLIDAKPKVIGYDTENTGLRWFAPDAAILTMQFCIEPGVAYVLPWDHPDMKKSGREKHRLKKQLRKLLCNPDTKVIGQGAKYDAVYTYARTGIRYRIGGCTLTLSSLLDENAKTRNLDDLVKRWVPEMAGYADGFNATVDKADMISLPLDKKFVDYAAGDADAVFRLNEVLCKEVSKDKKLLNHYNRVTLPGLNAFASIELRGMHIDEGQIGEFEEYMVQRIADMKKSLLRQVPKSIKRKHIELPKNKGKLEFTRPDFLLDILFRHEDGFRLTPKVFTDTTKALDDARKIPSVSTKKHLPYFYETCPFTLELSEYIKANRLLGTNVQGFKQKYIRDGKVRPVYNLHVAVTGRTSSEDPNGQNYPKRGDTAKAYRKMFVAPKGYFLLEVDLSQIELRIAADMANDPTMIRIYREGGDIHTATACVVMGISLEEFRNLPREDQKLYRFRAKAVNFGFVYGMWWRGFIAYAKTDYGIEFRESEAQNMRKKYFEGYYRLLQWHEAMRAYANRHKYVRSYSGRVRHLPMIDSSDDIVRQEAERQAINAPVQEFGSSLGVMSCGRMNEEVDSRYLELVGFVHDAIYAYVPEEYLEWGAKTLKYYMESNPIKEWFGVELKVPIVADVGFGVNLGEIVEMGDLESSEGGAVEVGVYDFRGLLEREGCDFVVPEQQTPPNNGRLLDSIYSHTV